MTTLSTWKFNIFTNNSLLHYVCINIFQFSWNRDEMIIFSLRNEYIHYQIMTEFHHTLLYSSGFFIRMNPFLLGMNTFLLGMPAFLTFSTTQLLGSSDVYICFLWIQNNHFVISGVAKSSFYPKMPKKRKRDTFGRVTKDAKRMKISRNKETAEKTAKRREKANEKRKVHYRYMNCEKIKFIL